MGADVGDAEARRPCGLKPFVAVLIGVGFMRGDAQIFAGPEVNVGGGLAYACIFIGDHGVEQGVEVYGPEGGGDDGALATGDDPQFQAAMIVLHKGSGGGNGFDRVYVFDEQGGIAGGNGCGVKAYA